MTNQIDDAPATILEILGLAGSGKSTTCEKLRDGDSSVLPVYRVGRRRLPGATLRALHWFAKDPSHRTLRDPAGGWTGLHLSIHMDAMVRDLVFQRRKRPGKLFLDQGPIFNCVSAERLAAQGEIHESVPIRMRELFFENLEFLDAIVVLDADLSILLHRIAERGQDHRIKGAGEASSRAFLEDYRERYDSIIDAIQERADVQVFRLDTGRQNPDQIVQAILGHLENSMSPRFPSTDTEFVR